MSALVERYEASATEMRKLLKMIHDDDLSLPNFAGRGSMLESVEQQIAITDKAAASVRKVLNDQALKAPAS